jgi:hypothetical protein
MREGHNLLSRLPQVYKTKASFLLGVARVRKEEKKRKTKMTHLPFCKKKHFLCFLCSVHIHKTSFFFLFPFSCRSHITASFLAFLNSPLFLVFYKKSPSFLFPFFLFSFFFFFSFLKFHINIVIFSQ